MVGVVERVAELEVARLHERAHEAVRRLLDRVAQGAQRVPEAGVVRHRLADARAGHVRQQPVHGGAVRVLHDRLRGLAVVGALEGPVRGVVAEHVAVAVGAVHGPEDAHGAARRRAEAREAVAQAVQRRVRAGGARGAVAERAGDLGVEAAG
ncbi:hypothetical protein EG870_15880, partial [Enterococcus faecalis]